ncbi:MAG TPA: tetratricopeptide repeat protein [Terriglobia bacterium]|nr:tetratricopeptide repeat protein [Terriglobia bacterium]
MRSRRFIQAILCGTLIAGWTFAQSADHFRRGLLLLNQQQFHKALREFTLAEQEHPSDARTRNFRGIALARLGMAREAAAEYREAIRLDPRLTEAYRNLGFLEWSLGQPVQAKRVFQQALRVQPDDPLSHYYLGWIELNEGHYAEAFNDLKSSRLPWPRNPDFLLHAATGYVTLKRNKDALKVADEINQLPLNDAELVSLGSLYLDLHQQQKAQALFKHLAQQHPNDWWAAFDLARAEYLWGDSGEAVRRAASLTARYNRWEAWALLGIADAHLGQHEASARAFRQAARLDPNHEERWLDLTRELMAQSQYAEAVQAAQEGLRHNPASYTLRLRLGAAYLNGGRYQEAEKVFRDLIAHNDPTPTAAIGLAQVLLRTGRAQEAVLILSQTRQRLGDSFLLAYFSGIALDRAGQHGDAIRAFKDALRFNPQSSEAHRWLGQIELQSRNATGAIEQLTLALKLDPSNRQAQLLLSQAYAMAHNPTAAANVTRNIKSGELPGTVGNESQDFSLPPWQTPPVNPTKNGKSAAGAFQ